MQVQIRLGQVLPSATNFIGYKPLCVARVLYGPEMDWTTLQTLVSGVAATLFVPLEPLLRIWLPIEQIAGVMPRVAVFFGGIAIAALGALAVIGMIYLTKWFVKATVKYARMTWRIITS